MAKPNPTFAGPEVIKIEVDQFNRVAMERKKDMKMEMEMLARERDLLRKEVGLSEKMQKYLELQKCSVEEKLEKSIKRCEELEENLGRSERRCEELEAKVNKLRQKLSRSRRKCEELRRKEIEAESRYGLRAEKKDSEKKDSAHLHMSRIEDLKPTVKEEKRKNVPSFVENVKVGSNVGDGDAISPGFIWISDHSGGDGGIFSEKEPRNEETTIAQVLNVNHVGKSIAAAATAEETPNVPESDENGKQKVNVGDGDGDAISPEVCGTSDKPGGNRGIELSTEGNRELFHGGTQEDGTKVDFTRPVSKPSYISEVAVSQGSVQDNDGKRPEAEVRGRTAADRFRPKEAYNSGTVIEKQVDRDETPVASRDVAFNLTRCCDLNIINQIKKHLHCENLKRFEKSCFGHFLNLNHLKYQGNVLLHLMMHMDMAASSNEKLVFRIKNSVVEFRPRDFSLITGLRLGELGPMIEMSSPSSSILRDVFKNRSTIFVTDIEAEFLSVSRANKGSGELVLKLAMLYFLHGNLLSDIPYSKKIDLKYFALVEDLDRFDEFPWGRLAFEFLALSMLSTRRWVDISNASNRRLSNQFMLGFSFALQVWAYETMPLLAEFCEARVVNPETTPTILRWSALKKLVRFKKLKVFFETDQGPSSEAKRLPREKTIRPIKEEKGKVCNAAKPSPSTAAGEVITISDDEDDDSDGNRRKRKRSEVQQAFAPAL